MKPDDAIVPETSRSAPEAKFDSLAIVILGCVAIVLVMSIVNMRNIARLLDRVVVIESRLESLKQPSAAVRGPDPSKVYTIKVAGAPAKGPEAATVTIAAFSEFQCPFCARVGPALGKIESVYKNRVRIVWKHMPLSIHRNAIDAALAAEAAGNQGKFWEYHDKLFANQTELEISDLKRYAKELNLDLSRMEKDMKDVGQKRKIEADMEEARSLGVSSTPSFFINGRFIRGAQPFEAFSKIIDEELAKANVPAPTKDSPQETGN